MIKLPLLEMQAAPSQKQQIPEQIGHGSLKGERSPKEREKKEKKKKNISAPQLCHVHPCGQGTEVSGNFKNADLLCTLQWCSVKMLVSSVCSYRQINVHSKYILV